MEDGPKRKVQHRRRHNGDDQQKIKCFEFIKFTQYCSKQLHRKNIKINLLCSSFIFAKQTNCENKVPYHSRNQLAKVPLCISLQHTNIGFQKQKLINYNQAAQKLNLIIYKQMKRHYIRLFSYVSLNQSGQRHGFPYSI